MSKIIKFDVINQQHYSAVMLVRDNLKWGSHKQNMELAVINKMYADFSGELNPQAKFTSNQVVKIRESVLSTESLCKQYGICKSHLWRIRNGKSWKSVI